MRRSEVLLRSCARRLGLMPLVKRIRSRGRHDGERAVWHALAAGIRPRDVVWDIGANVGLYSVRFSRAVGPSGQVWAFEPVPRAREQLVAAVATGDGSNVEVVAAAMGDRPGSVTMEVGEMTALSRVITPVVARAPRLESEEDCIEVEVCTGDAFRRERGLPAPNVLKIDVEGFEIEVLQGLHDTLRDRTCRAVMVEVHFRLLEERGNRGGPLQVESLLRDAGFDVAWVDPSHVWATRPEG